MFIIRWQDKRLTAFLMQCQFQLFEVTAVMIYYRDINCPFNPFSPRKIEKHDLWDSKISQTLNAIAKSINLHIIRKLIKYSLKKIFWRPCLPSAISRYCCSKLGQYHDQPSWSQGAEGLKFQWQTKEMFGFYWNCLKSHCLTDFGGFEWFSFF